MTDNYLYGGMIRLHILHHANDAPVYGLGIVEELRHHGYEISSGTLYPLLHGLEKKVISTHIISLQAIVTAVCMRLR